MKSHRMIAAIVVFALVELAAAVSPAQQTSRASASFDKLKGLAGEWEGKANEGGREINSLASFRVVSDGSALMSILNSGTPDEMVTMFHLDGSDLLATHYCSAHNQPRFRMVASSEPNAVAFKFKDATNLSSPKSPHMVGIKITILDANHHYEDWTFLSGGQTATTRFDFHRKK